MKKWSIALAIGVMAGVLCGCVSGISARSRSQVTFHGTFEQLVHDPLRYTENIVLLGGKIIETRVGASGGDIIVLQLHLDASDRPLDDDRSGGRFVVRSDRFVDPALYPPGKLMTVVGRIRGVETKPVDQFQYRYPVIEMIEIKAWPEAEVPSGPRFHFGIGIGTSF